jgi:hypothetical protein
MGDFVEVVGSRYPEAHDLFEGRDHVEWLHIFGEYNFHDLSAHLRVFIFFAMWTGLLSSKLLVECETITGIVKRFIEMGRNGNGYLTA